MKKSILIPFIVFAVLVIFMAGCESQEKAKYGGVYRSCELCLAYMNALAAGNPDAEVVL